MRGSSQAALLQRLHTGLERAGCYPCPGAHWLVGVSGGADSVALLRLLALLAEPVAWRLTAVHLHHGLRKRAADEDLRAVMRLGEDLRVPVVVGRGDVRALARRQAVSLEMAARNARLAFFRIMVRRHGARGVLLAHTADDQAETVLMRLARGTALKGVGGMSYCAQVAGVTLVRPLLDCRGAELRAWLQTRGWTWREDSTNQEPQFLRNRVRHELLPLLAARLNPQVRAALARFACLASEDDAYLQAEAQRRYHPDALLDCERARDLPLPLLRRCLSAWLSARGVPAPAVDCRLLERLVRLIRSQHGTKHLALPDGARIVRRYRYCVYERDNQDLQPPGRVAFLLRRPGTHSLGQLGVRIAVRRVRSGDTADTRGILGTLPATTLIDGHRLGRAGLQVRCRRPGDRYAPAGMSGSVKIQDLFVNARVPADRRDSIPLLVCRERVVWIPGRAPARGWSPETPGPRDWKISMAPL